MATIPNRNSIIELQSDTNPALRFAWQALLVVAGIGIITASAKIQVPFWPVPMTLQTLAIMTIFASYGLRLSLATIFGYIGVGLVGLPVFAGALAGPIYLAGPTAGFLLGFILAAIIVGYAADRGFSSSPFKLFGAMLVADVVIFAVGFAWFGFVYVSQNTGTTLGGATAFSIAVQPFILADLVKITLAASIVPAMWVILKRLRG